MFSNIQHDKREQLKNDVDEYLKRGGKIKTITQEEYKKKLKRTLKKSVYGGGIW